jgi:PAS domain S-box-containing protein
MKTQRETSLRIRLAGLAILGLFIALAAAAYFSGRQVKRNSELIVTDAVPGVIFAHDMRMAMSRSVGYMMVAASAQTTQSRDASIKVAHDADVAFTNAVTQYKGTIKINPAEDESLLNEVTSRFAEFQRQRMNYEALILAGDRDGSAAYLETNLVPAYASATQSAEDLLKYNNSNSTTYANYIRNSVHRLYWAVAVVMVLSLVCAAVLVVNFAIRRREIMKLRESEEKFAKAFQSSPSGITISELATGRIIEVNESYCRIQGYSSPQEMIGRTSVEVGVFRSAEERQRVFQPLLDGHTMRDSEVQIRTPDGGRRTILFNAELIELGGKQCIVSLAQDITERKRSQDELIWKTALLEAQVDSTLDGILVVDTMGKKILQNQRFLEMLKVPDEIASDDDDANMLQHAANQMKNPGQFRERVIFLYGNPDEIGREEIELADGRVFDRYSAPVRDKAGKRFGRIWTFRDITGQKRVEEEIRATNERYSRQEAALIDLTRAYALRRSSVPELKRKVTEITAQTLEVERISIWCYESDHQGIVCKELFERSAQSHSSGMALRAKDYPSYFRALAEGNIIAAHDAYLDPRTTEFSESYLRPHGISSMMDAPIHVIGGVAGVVCCEHVGPARQWTADEQTFAIAIANVVSLQLAEEERQQIEGQFRQSQKMEAVGQLASGVAHDFNNILGIIQMQSDMLKTESTLSPAQSGYASEIGEAVERAAALTRQLLLFGRKEKMQARELDLNQSINDMTKMLRRTLGENIELQFKFSMQPLFINADAGMMDQVLMNLAVNARDAMPKGGKIIIEASAVIFDDSIKDQYVQASAGSFVCLSVSDTGSGIPPEILPKIFEPFFTTKDVGKGTGLGLATVFGIVQQHKGWINVYSEVGQGTTFRIYIPRLAKISDQKFVSPLTESASGGNETILVVEDEPKLRASVINMLSRLGYNVLEAHDGADALEVWNQHRDGIHLLLTDMVMPGGMTGKDLGERLLKENPKLKVIYASGYSTDVAARDFPLEEGVNFLSKPFQAQKLARIVRERLDAKI